MDRAY